MNEYDFLIIGGGIAGTTAAETIRKEDPYSSIAILEREPNPLYSRVLIPRYLKGTMNREKVFLRHFEDYQKQKIDFFSNTEVTGLNLDRREVYGDVVSDTGSAPKIFSYKKLLIASGGRPRPALDNLALGPNVLALRMQTLQDADTIYKTLTTRQSETALVVGDGFIALEFLESFLVHGFKVNLAINGDKFNVNTLGENGSEIFED